MLDPLVNRGINTSQPADDSRAGLIVRAMEQLDDLRCKRRLQLLADSKYRLFLLERYGAAASLVPFVLSQRRTRIDPRLVLDSGETAAVDGPQSVIENVSTDIDTAAIGHLSRRVVDAYEQVMWLRPALNLR